MNDGEIWIWEISKGPDAAQKRGIMTCTTGQVSLLHILWHQEDLRSESIMYAQVLNIKYTTNKETNVLAKIL